MIDLDKKIYSYKYYDVDWSSIYATKILENFEDDCKQYDLLETFFKNINKYDSRVKENMYNLISFSNVVEKILPYLENLKTQLTNYESTSEIDSLLGLFESINIEHDISLSFLNEYDLKPNWIDEYAKNIAKN